MQVREETVLFSKPAMIETRHKMLIASTDPTRKQDREGSGRVHDRFP
jgi:hypothetical protein